MKKILVSISILFASSALVLPVVSHAAIDSLNGLLDAVQSLVSPGPNATNTMHMEIVQVGTDKHRFRWDGTPWRVDQGGTGTTSFPQGAILVGNGSDPITTVPVDAIQTKPFLLEDSNGTFLGFILDAGSGGAPRRYTTYLPDMDLFLTGLTETPFAVGSPNRRARLLAYENVYYDQVNCQGNAFINVNPVDPLFYHPQGIMQADTAITDPNRLYRGTSQLTPSPVNVLSVWNQNSCSSSVATISAFPLIQVSLPFNIANLQLPLVIDQ